LYADLHSLCLVVALGGCETAPTYSSSPSEQMTVVHPGDAVASVLGTPFYLVGGRSAWGQHRRFERELLRSGDPAWPGRRYQPALRPALRAQPYRVVSVEPKADVPETPAPEQPTRVPDVPAPPRSLDPAPGTPKVSTPARPPKSPPDYSAAPMTEQVPEPAAGGPIKLFNGSY
jgi:hypothetical protein